MTEPTYVDEKGHYRSTDGGHPVVFSGMCPTCKTAKVYWNGRPEFGPQTCVLCGPKK